MSLLAQPAVKPVARRLFHYCSRCQRPLAATHARKTGPETAPSSSRLYSTSGTSSDRSKRLADGSRVFQTQASIPIHAQGHLSRVNAARLSSTSTATAPSPSQSSSPQPRRRPLVFSPPQYEVVETCPDPECACAEMPRWLPIDKTSKMGMPYYDRHVLTTAGSTFPVDHSAALRWPSKIESDPRDLLTLLKAHLGPKGAAYRPDFSVSVTASTLPSSQPGVEDVWLFPDFVRMRVRRAAGATAATPSSPSPAKGFKASGSSPRASSSSSSPTSSTAAFFDSTPDESALLAKIVVDDAPVQVQSQRASDIAQLTPITQPVVLICGHGKRDPRCRDLGPLLLAEFEKHLVDPAATASEGEQHGSTPSPPRTPAHLALVSHIGGHKFAGNVVIYMPPSEAQAPQYEGHYGGQGARGKGGVASTTPIDGMGVWYGRVEPRHVEGIVKETLRSGRVIGELLRGVHDFGGAIWR